MLGQVVYRSEAVFPEGHLSNLDILREALARNSGQGLTGFLMRDRTHFLQVIEGPMGPPQRPPERHCTGLATQHHGGVGARGALHAAVR